MKVFELIEFLKGCDQDSDVIMQKDPEGNGYSPLAGADNECVYVQESSYSGEVYSVSDSADDNLMEENEWQELLTGPRVVVLWPTY